MRGYLLGLVTLFMAMTTSAENMNFNEVDKNTRQQIEQHFLDSLVGDNPADRELVEIDMIRQIGSSDVFMLSFTQAFNTYQMTYLRQIDSVVIHQTSQIISLSDKSVLDKEYSALVTKPQLQQIKSKDVIAYNSSQSDSQTVYVFTDHTCPYCQKLHQGIEEYNDAGVNIHYLPFPRGGMNHLATKDLVHTYCAKDRKAAFDELKKNPNQGTPSPKVSYSELAECEALVEKYYLLGRKIGVSGTPAIFDTNGHQLGGYLDAPTLKRALNQ